MSILGIGKVYFEKWTSPSRSSGARIWPLEFFFEMIVDSRQEQ
jgi:hypothetical protein